MSPPKPSLFPVVFRLTAVVQHIVGRDEVIRGSSGHELAGDAIFPSRSRDTDLAPGVFHFVSPGLADTGQVKVRDLF